MQNKMFCSPQNKIFYPQAKTCPLKFPCRSPEERELHQIPLSTHPKCTLKRYCVSQNLSKKWYPAGLSPEPLYWLQSKLQGNEETHPAKWINVLHNLISFQCLKRTCTLKICMIHISTVQQNINANHIGNFKFSSNSIEKKKQKKQLKIILIVSFI